MKSAKSNTGFKNVCLNTRHGFYDAQIKINGKRIYKTFQDLAPAVVWVREQRKGQSL